MPNVQSVKPWATQEQETVSGQWHWSSFSQRQEKVSLLKLALPRRSQCSQPPLTFPPSSSDQPWSIPGTLTSLRLSFEKRPSGRKNYAVSSEQATASRIYFSPVFKKMKQGYHFPKIFIRFWLWVVNLEIYSSQRQWWILWIGQTV